MAFRWHWDVLDDYEVTLGCSRWLSCGCGVFLDVYGVF